MKEQSLSYLLPITVKRDLKEERLIRSVVQSHQICLFENITPDQTELAPIYVRAPNLKFHQALHSRLGGFCLNRQIGSLLTQWLTGRINMHKLGKRKHNPIVCLQCFHTLLEEVGTEKIIM